MKVAVIIIAIKGSKKYATALSNKFKTLRIAGLRTFIVINQKGKEGYSAGVNKGIAMAKEFRPDIYVIANPDLTNLKITKSNLVEGARNFDLWGYHFKQGKRIFTGGDIDKNRLTAGLRTSSVHFGNVQNESFQSVDFVSGSLICFTKKTLSKVGLWNENYHMYYEDVEYCVRAKKNGLRVGVVNKVAYEHLEFSKTNKDKEFQLAVSWVRFFIANAGLRNWLYELLRLPKTLFEYRTLIFDQIKKRPFVYNFMTLNFTSLAIKMLNFVLFLFLVRYFTANQFGLYNLVWAQIGLFMPLADLGTTNYGIFHLKKSSRREFSNLFSLRLVLSVVIATVTLIYTFLVFKQKELFFLTLLSSPVVLSNAVSGSFLIYTTLLSRTYLASYYSLIFNTALIGILIGLVVGRSGLRALFLAEGIWFSFYAVFIWLRTNQLVKLHISWPKLSYLKSIASKSYMYILLTFFAGLYFKIDLLILQYFKGLAVVGIYAAGFKFFEALIFLGASYTIAATPIYKQHLLDDIPAVKKKIIRDSVLLFSLGMLIATVSWFAAPLVLPLALGKEFVGGVDVFRVVVFALPFLLVSAVCMNVLYLLKKVHWVVMIFVLLIVLNVVGNVIFVPLFSYQASAIITVLCEVLNAVLTVPLVFKAYEDIGRRRGAMQS